MFYLTKQNNKVILDVATSSPVYFLFFFLLEFIVKIWIRIFCHFQKKKEKCLDCFKRFEPFISILIDKKGQN